MPTIYFSEFAVLLKPNWYTDISSGAAKLGYGVSRKEKYESITSKDVLILWNRHLEQDAIAKKFEAVGAKVLILENAYIKQTGQWISVGIGYHNNIKHSIPCMDEGQRFESFGIEIKPWRTAGKHILYASQSHIFNARGLGLGEYASPAGFDLGVLKEIRKHTNRTIHCRLHPKCKMLPELPTGIYSSHGKFKTMEEDLAEAWATVVWTSNAATESLLAGVPVFVSGPSVFASGACNISLESLEDPVLPDNRLEIFRRMAWSQYNRAECQSGFFLKTILDNIT